MNATLARKLRFSDVVYAIDTTPKSLRLWLQRKRQDGTDLVKIDTARQEGGGWTEFSFTDVMILALVRHLVNFGINVPTASDIANEAMKISFPQMLMVKHPEKMPASALATMWVNRRLYVFPTADEKWQIEIVALWESQLGKRAELAKALPHRAVKPEDAKFRADAPSGIAEIRKELEPAAAFLSIDVETVFRTAIERANESVNDGQDDE